MPGEPGNETWLAIVPAVRWRPRSDDPAPGDPDPNLDLLGHGKQALLAHETRPGDNLYTALLIVIDPEHG